MRVEQFGKNCRNTSGILCRLNQHVMKTGLVRAETPGCGRLNSIEVADTAPTR